MKDAHTEVDKPNIWKWYRVFSGLNSNSINTLNTDEENIFQQSQCLSREETDQLLKDFSLRINGEEISNIELYLDIPDKFCPPSVLEARRNKRREKRAALKRASRAYKKNMIMKIKQGVPASSNEIVDMSLEPAISTSRNETDVVSMETSNSRPTVEGTKEPVVIDPGNDESEMPLSN